MIDQDALFKILVHLAKTRGMITHIDLSDKLDIPYPQIGGRNHLCDALNKISLAEQAEQRPMLSSVVYSHIENLPHKSFFQLAVSLEKMMPGFPPTEFWIKELQDTWDFWEDYQP